MGGSGGGGGGGGAENLQGKSLGYLQAALGFQWSLNLCILETKWLDVSTFNHLSLVAAWLSTEYMPFR